MVKSTIKLFCTVLIFAVLQMMGLICLMHIVSFLYSSSLDGILVGMISYVSFLAYICFLIGVVGWLTGCKKLR